MTKSPNPTLAPVRELLEMHTYARPSGSKGERAFIAKYLTPLPGVRTDEAGNIILTVGKDPSVLWSSHTDTVHRETGKVRVTYGDGMLTLSKGEKASCLGADCSAGVWIMRQMILRNVPGLYIFHAAEEVGGIGSAHIANRSPKLLEGVKHAIAFDRKGTTSVITHQGGRTASDTFAAALCKRLGPAWKPDATGTFTDTANYADLVPECTNISVGYYGAHTASEALDVRHTVTLLEAMCRLNTASLPVARDPAPRWKAWPANVTRSVRGSRWALDDLVAERPDIAADLLRSLGVTAGEFEAAQHEADHADVSSDRFDMSRYSRYWGLN